MKMDSLQTQILDIMRQSGPYDQDQNKGKYGIATSLQQGDTVRLTMELAHISLCYIHCTVYYLYRVKIYQ